MVNSPTSLDRHLFMTLFTRVACNGAMESRSMGFDSKSAGIQDSKPMDRHQ